MKLPRWKLARLFQRGGRTVLSSPNGEGPAREDLGAPACSQGGKASYLERGRRGEVKPMPEARSPKPEARRIVRYSLEASLVLVPLAVVIYFLAYPDQFDAFLNWLVGRR